MNETVVYCLTTGAQTYVGATKNIRRRLRQHNGEIKGGAKYTSRFAGRWRVLFYCTGFTSWKECLSFEWHLKHVRKYKRGENPEKRRWNNVATMLQRPRWPHIEIVRPDVPREVCQESENTSNDPVCVAEQEHSLTPVHHRVSGDTSVECTNLENESSLDRC